MKGKLKYILGLLFLGGLVVFLGWKYVQKPNDDLSAKRPEAIFSFRDIMDKMSADTAALSQLVDNIVAVKGTVKKMTTDSVYTRVELGDTTSMSSIICDIDCRHQPDFLSVKEGQEIFIKGKLTSFTIDTELGLGNTITMIFCTLNK